MLDFCTNTIYNSYMDADNIIELNNNIAIQKIKVFLSLKDFSCNNNISLVENIKVMCVKKLCNVIGIKCECNYKNEFFNYFSSITGEAICQLLNIPIVVAEDNFRLFKYNHINFVEHVKNLLKNEFLEDAYVDVFNFLDNNKHLFNIG